MRKWSLRLLVLLTFLIGALALAAWAVLRASLPPLDGRVALHGLKHSVTVERDALGVPTLRARDRLDLARATGFVHAQDRFVQMDFIRRSAAGEVSELIGAPMIQADRAARLHRLRAFAQGVLRQANPDEAALIQAYTEGVNAGLASLQSRPYEYLLLGLQPQPWRPEDTLLVVLMMWFQLTDETAERDAMLGVMHDVLPPPVYDFVTQSGTRWDAPLEGERLPEVPLPGPGIYDLRGAPAVQPRTSDAGSSFESALGSNSWAVDAARSADGHAWVANDMHMSIAVPNNWYRVRLVIEGALDATGVMLPGTPVLSVGSNRHVAWSFTNVFGDFSDRVLIEPDPSDPARYLTPAGSQPYVTAHETIRVKGGGDVPLEVKTTIWGPVVKGPGGRDEAVWWLAAQPGAINLRLGWLEQARSVEEAMAVAQGAGIPPQNFVVADREGRIGWSIVGVLPQRRAGFDSTRPQSWARQPGVTGFLPPRDYPAVVAPAEGRLWTANARTARGDGLQRLGDGGYDVGARAGRIRDALRTFERATREDHLRLQLDTKAPLLAPWQPWLVKALEGLSAKSSHYSIALEQVRQWGGRADPQSVGYRLVREFHDALRDRMFDALCAPCRAREPAFKRVYLKQWDEAALRILEGEAVHLLPPPHESVQSLVEDVASALVDGIPDLAAHRWGARNTLRMQHGIGRLLPLLSPLVDMPRSPMPGDADVVRVQGPEFGASERFAVSPGREESGYFHMPGGQSGHPLSPFYRAGHDAWVEGRPMPFLPGAAQHVLELHP